MIRKTIRKPGDMFIGKNGAIFLCVTRMQGFYIVRVQDVDNGGKEMGADISAILRHDEYLDTDLCQDLAYIGNIGNILEHTAEKQRPHYEELREKSN